MEEFINVVSEFEQDDFNLEAQDDLGMLGNFLSQVALVSDVDEVKDEENSVTLMTLHASKGLEFRRVYLIDLNEGLVPHRRAKTKEEIEEERRVLYVAMTRAKEELYLLYTEKRGGREIPPSRFLHGLM